MHIGITKTRARTHKQEVKKVRGSKDKGKDKSGKKVTFSRKKRNIFTHTRSQRKKEGKGGRERKVRRNRRTD